MNKELLLKTFRNATGAAVYIFLVSLVMRNGEKLFGQGDDNILMPFAILLLFSLSAAVVGWLIFGQSVTFFLEGKRKDGVSAAVYNIGWLAMYAILGLLTLFVLK